jgi:hypothetical protein
MSYIFSILLLFVGFIGTALAFGGDAWRKGHAPLIERITWRGWMSIGCAAVALILGTLKEIDDKREEVRKENEAKIVEGLKEKVAQQDKDFLNAQLKAARDETKGVQTTLDQANKSLGVLRSSLSSTQEDLDRESVIELENALANGERKVVSLQIFLPLSRRVKRGVSLGDVLEPETKCPRSDLDIWAGIGHDGAWMRGINLDKDFYVTGEKNSLQVVAVVHPEPERPFWEETTSIFGDRNPLVYLRETAKLISDSHMTSNSNGEAVFFSWQLEKKDIPAYKWVGQMSNGQRATPLRFFVYFRDDAPASCR